MGAFTFENSLSDKIIILLPSKINSFTCRQICSIPFCNSFPLSEFLNKISTVPELNFFSEYLLIFFITSNSEFVIMG